MRFNCNFKYRNLNHRKVKFKEYDVTDNPKAYKWLQDNVGQIVTPVIDFGGTVVLGFDRPKIDIALRG